MSVVFLKELLAFAIRKRKIFRVGGDSMLPALQANDIIFVRPDTQCSKGDIVVIRHPYKKTIVIKHVAEIDDDLIELRSPHGTDSRQFGKSSLKNLVGVATYNYTKKMSLTKAEFSS